MKHLAELIGSELILTQQNALKQEFEIKAMSDLAGTIKLKSSFTSLATAESADGCWTFKRSGFWQTKAAIRVCGSDAELGLFQKMPGKAAGFWNCPMDENTGLLQVFGRPQVTFAMKLENPLFILKLVESCVYLLRSILSRMPSISRSFHGSYCLVVMSSL
jgi:hypothetical protein